MYNSNKAIMMVKAAQELIETIMSKYGCYTCVNITGISFKKPEGLKLFYEQGIPEKTCYHVVKDAVEIVEEIW